MDEAALNELLECSVCLEQLDHTSKVLPCQHTFCRRCLEEIHSTKHELRCPECRFLVEIPVEDLPSNILLIRLLEGLKTQVRVQAGGRRSRGADQALGLRADNSVGAAAFARQQQQRQIPTSSTCRPCAEALFNYEGKDPGDLSFKKGDTVYLRKQVDENWYHGEMNGQHGFFPATYVKVKVALPATLPQCVGLYDFEVDESKEKDCLPFKKDEMVTVIRQVDDNWLEGKKGDKIGIFPVSFVKLNDPARKLLSLFGSSNGIPEIPEQGPPVTPAHPVRTSKEGSPAGEIVPQTKPQNKRHSLTSITGSPILPSSVPQRRSLEITSDTDFLGAGAALPPVPSGRPTPPLVTTGEQPPAIPSGRPTPTLVTSSGQLPAVPSGRPTPTLVTSGGQPPAVPSGRPTPSLVTSGGQLQGEATGAQSSPGLARSKDTSIKLPDSNTPPLNDTKQKEPELGPVSAESEPSLPPPTNVNTPQIYTAVYNYKPQKTDELELRKGDFYTVFEKCQDGWFKGQCLKIGISGVFPGNYVQLCSTHSSAFKAVGKNNGTKVKDTVSGQGHSQIPSASSAPSLSGALPIPPRPKTSPGRASSADRENVPPPLVPRSAKLTSPQHNLSSASSSRHSPTTTVSGTKQGSPLLGAAKATSSTLSKPTSPRDRRGNKHDISSHSGGERSHHGGDRGSAAHGATSGNSVSPVWKHSMSVCANITPPNVALGTKGITAPGLSTAEMGAVSHMHGIKDKDKKERKDIKERLIQMKRLATGKGKKSKHSSSDADVLVTHNRSGSCPSDGSSSDSGHHKKTGSFDSTANPPKPSRPKPLVRERFRCIETYPPQSEVELDLKIGDIIYVHKKREDGWFKGTLQRSGKTGLFPGSFAEKCD